MNQTLPPIIQTKELLKLRSSENLVVIDAGSGKSTQNRYNEKHLEGALYVDLDDQLAAIGDDPAKGGRHPLPTAEQFSKTLTGLGISRQSHVAIYDDKNGANSAARFWWMLKAIDHEKVQVLDGGLQEAEKNGFPMSSRQETPKKVQPYPIAHWQLPQADMNEVERVSQNKNYRVIDVREADRYKGLTEPIDLIAGHIPGAINVPFKTNLSDDGLFNV